MRFNVKEMNVFENYYSEVDFKTYKEIPTAQNLIDLETKKGIVINTRTTSLWLSRSLKVMDFLGIATTMESIKEFMIRDDLGSILYKGTPEEIIDYVKGWTDRDSLITMYEKQKN